MSLTLGKLRQHYDSVWCVDFEYNTGISGADAPKPICMVAQELFTGATVRKWLWDGLVTGCPIPTDDHGLYIAFYASAEITCHLGLGWPIPARILDLYAEFRCVANSLANFQVTSVEGKTKGQQRFSLLNCMRSFGLGAEAVGTGFKNESRDLCIRGGPFSEAEKTQILEYCESDVIALAKLLPCMLPFIELHQALFRGRYMAAVASMERRGIPVDQELAGRFRDHWDPIVNRLIVDSKSEFDVIGKRDIDQKKFAAWLESHGLLHSWPRSSSKSCSLRSDTDTNGLWDDKKNWTLSLNPAHVHDVTINPDISLTVQGPGGNSSVRKLEFGGGNGVATLNLNGGNLASQFPVRVLSNGVLRGDGQITGTVVNLGTTIAENITVHGDFANAGVLRGDGRMNVSGQLLNQLTIQGNVELQAAGGVTNAVTGQFRVGTGESMKVKGFVNPFVNQGVLEVIGGQLEIEGPTTNAADTGLIAIRDGTIRFNGGQLNNRLTNDGSIGVTFGTSDIFGDIHNTASGIINVSGGANVTF